MEMKWGFIKICLYFSAFNASINAQCTFFFPLLQRLFEGTFNGNSACGVMSVLKFFMEYEHNILGPDGKIITRKIFRVFTRGAVVMSTTWF